ncbi:hypothetical protein DB347_01120 [Opitutaceae bacterium EW11]|nr:hypothetical protein DB347_01120 [Opitutaceae bacterium EW11]
MKRVFRLFLALGALAGMLGSGGGIRAAETATPLDPYTQAVQDYVRAARAETSAVGAEVKKNENGPRSAAYVPVKNAVEDCERLIEQLKVAGPSRFDSVKAQYELARAELMRKLETARRG